MRPRIEQELAFLRENFPDVEHTEAAGQDWFLLPRHQVPPGWQIGDDAINEAPLCFLINAAHPQGAPYGFWGPSGLNFKGQAPNNAAAADGPPFAGKWVQFSWHPEHGWAPTADVRRGSNLVAWVRSFQHRLKEGV